MWRGKSSGDGSRGSGRGGSGQSGGNRSKNKGKGREAQQSSRRAGSGDEARRGNGGKKIRRIESGSPGGRGDRRGAGPVGPRSARSTGDGAGRGRGENPNRAQDANPNRSRGEARGRRRDGARRPADQTEIGAPPSGPPTQIRQGGQRPEAAPNLPPLVQPTGELPVVRGDAPGDTVTVAGPSDGVFAERPTDAVTDSAQAVEQMGPGEAANFGQHSIGSMADEPFTIAEDSTAVMPSVTAAAGADRRAERAQDGLNDLSPELGQVGSQAAQSLRVVGDDDVPATPADDVEIFDSGDDAASPFDGLGAVAAKGAAAGAAGMGAVAATAAAGRARVGSDDAPTNPFPEVGDELTAASTVPDRVAGAESGAYDPFADTGDGRGVRREAVAAQGVGGRAPSGPGPAKAAATTKRPPDDSGRPLNAAYEPGRAPGSPRPARRSGGAPAGAERLQDTEFKLADKRRKQKPKEPNRLVLALAMGLVVLVGVGVAWFLTRDDSTDEVAGDEAQAEVEPESVTTQPTVEELPQAEPEPQVDEPTLFFDDAQLGPLQEGEAYSIDLVGEPEGSMLQVVVDDIPQGDPDPLLPDLILPPGRHTLHVNMINGDVVAASTPVSVYVLGDPPSTGYRANLSSVNFQTEGWQEAIRQFDDYRAAGHEGLELHPISDGFWNIYVGGFGEIAMPPRCTANRSVFRCPTSVSRPTLKDRAKPPPPRRRRAPIAPTRPPTTATR